MTLIAYDIYSGFIEDTLNVLGSRDMTLMERYQRLGDYSQHALGLLPDVMDGWEKALETLIMNPPAQLTTLAEAVALIIIMRDAGQRRFRIITEGRRDDILLPTFDHLGHPEFNKDFIRSEIGGFTSPVPEIDWGFLDINQVEALLLDATGNDSFKDTKTAVIAGRLSNMARSEAEHALIDVGIETQNSISHNIDYLILGSKGTGGTKHDKVQNLKDGGRKITVLDEAGFEALLRSPKQPPEHWLPQEKENYEDLVRSLRHIWAFGLDIYCLSFVYDPEENIL
ncbi:MAG: BRCT domain-containing protein [Proteobacteria bacterium]|nr:BRCT domain-containing protein [Pseudomonadota bacterium]